MPLCIILYQKRPLISKLIKKVGRIDKQVKTKWLLYVH